MIKIYFARHGETEWNKKGYHQTHTDISLNGRGIKQAQNYGKYFHKKKIEIIFHSPMSRVKETVQYMNLKALKIEDKRLKDLSLSFLDGMTIKEVKEKYPDIYNNRKKDKFHYCVPKGESYEIVLKRIKPFIDDLIKKYKNHNILIVGHQGVNRAMIGYLLGMKEKLVNINTPLSSIYELKINDKREVFNIYKGKRRRGLLFIQ